MSIRSLPPASLQHFPDFPVVKLRGVLERSAGLEGLQSGKEAFLRDHSDKCTLARTDWDPGSDRVPSLFNSA